MKPDKLRYWVGFNRTKGIGPARLSALIQHFGDVETAWKASGDALRQVGLDQRTLGSLLATRAKCDLDAELQAIERAGAQVITIEDAAYPALLRKIADPPTLLYVKGTLTAADEQAIAIVGTRLATAYGKTMTQRLVPLLVQNGITIVSGLALGIDSVAHRAALECGGRTIAVLPNGIDHIYPPENRQLAEEITASGALITELPLGAVAEKRHFAPRNRLVSGLALGVVVIEAGAKSGALITADQALEQGREVFAVPGNVLSPSSTGTNTLIQAGAKMVTEAEDILDELKLNHSFHKVVINIEKRTTTRPPTADSDSELRILPHPDSDTEARILHCLALQPQHIDDLSRQIGMPIPQISSALTVLQLKGLVREVGIMQYALNEA